MNEYLTTVVASEHRRDLLDEAAANGLARTAREGRPTFWSSLAGLLRTSAGGRWPERRAAHARDHSRTHRFAH